jgi:hypothetical protein
MRRRHVYTRSLMATTLDKSHAMTNDLRGPFEYNLDGTKMKVQCRDSKQGVNPMQYAQLL